jgi:hypothetical protein
MNLVVQPDAYAVFAYTTDSSMNGGVTAQVAYGMGSSVAFSNSADYLQLTYGGATIDRVQYGSGWPGLSGGASICLRAPYPMMGRSSTAAWSHSVGTFGPSADQGSPGQPNTAQNCP